MGPRVVWLREATIRRLRIVQCELLAPFLAMLAIGGRLGLLGRVLPLCWWHCDCQSSILQFLNRTRAKGSHVMLSERLRFCCSFRFLFPTLLASPGS